MSNTYIITALNYLNKNSLSHMNMIESIRLNKSTILYAEEHGVLLYDTHADLYMLSVHSQEYLEPFLIKISNPQLICVHQQFIVDEITKRFSLHEFMQCKQAVYTSLDLIFNDSQSNIKPLDISYLDEVEKLYSHDVGIEYLQERIQSKELFGYFIHDELVAFIGLHAEGSMGLLEVTHKYRKQGIGFHLLSWLIQHLLKEQRIPFSQITIDNKASFSLHEKLGFEFSKETIYWMEK